MGGPERETPALAEVLTRASLDDACRIVLGLKRTEQLSLTEILAGVPPERAEEILTSLPRVRKAPRAEREAPTLNELRTAVSRMPADQAGKIMARATPRPPAPPASGEPPPVIYTSWENYLARTTPAERRRWRAAKAAKANSFRLMSGRPETTISADDVLAVLERARGRCAYCGSLAVERRPPGPWGDVGRRIGSLGHRVARFNGRSKTLPPTSPGAACGAIPGPKRASRARPTTAVTSPASGATTADKKVSPFCAASAAWSPAASQPHKDHSFARSTSPARWPAGRLPHMPRSGCDQER
jgi:hypothetical protein